MKRVDLQRIQCHEQVIISVDVYLKDLQEFTINHLCSLVHLSKTLKEDQAHTQHSFGLTRVTL